MVSGIQALLSQYQQKYPLYTMDNIVELMLNDGAITIDIAKKIKSGVSLFIIDSELLLQKKDNNFSTTEIMGGYFTPQKTQPETNFNRKIEPTFQSGKQGDSPSPSKIANMLVDAIFGIGTGNIEEAINQINNDNIIDVLSLYQEKANQKNSIVNFKYDNESLFEAILDENIPKNKKRQYFKKIAENLIYGAQMDDEAKEHYRTALRKATDIVLNNPWPIQNSKEVDNLVNEILEINRKNLEKTYSCKIKNVESYINKDDILGNGNIDNPSKQLSGNCRVHAFINAIIINPKSRAYLNSLISKDKSTGNISIYLPGAKAENQPKPKGDGIYTYTENQILNNINIYNPDANKKDMSYSFATSIGDGDETALLMAMQDFLKETKDTNEGYALYQEFFSEFGLDGNSSINAFGADDYYKAIFGQEGKDIYSDLFYESFDYDLEITNNEKFKFLKEQFNSGKYIITVGSIKVPENVKQIDTTGNLLSAHEYAIQSYGENTITLIESNAPQKPITLSIDDFYNIMGMLEIYPLPKDIQ